MATSFALQPLPDLKIKLLSIFAYLPQKATLGACGFDVLSPIRVIIPARTQQIIFLDIAIEPPSGTYVKLESRSGLIINTNLEVKGGIIDPDYRGVSF